MKKKISISLIVAALLSSVAIAEVTSLRGDQEIGANNEVPKIKAVPKHQERFALNYVNQPPMVPHSVEGYQVNQSNNACLQCHDVDVYRKTGAPRVSPTHFMDRDNKVLTDVSPRRYFCLQCHVPQVQAEELVENEFVPAGKFGQ
ncbi:Periplasmic nitrate reductase, electron transfer subunit precursor [Grimontia celer]|uniref:Periplasmic nitrate reductase, electron transfer subunit n=1 Tax=Grimontia celer TaxID=1796497 RepID=A0A128EX15_9GAMM|nr:nitrate reductase cytochrome c-type subunit [Grimontia celer]CZF79108.1 Periplasmic nitrate reductase, electron transfer subunit precursor [Grimontia celer]